MSPESRTVAFYTLGCKLNYAETSTIARKMEQDGFRKVEFGDGADIYVINTCSVTENADKECRYIVRRALRVSPDAKVVVIGCYAQLKPAEIASIEGVDLVLGAKEKFNLAQFINTLPEEKKDKQAGVFYSCDINEVNFFQSSYSFGERTRAFLKVQDGCDYSCTYCTIPLARGKSRSDSVANVVKQANEVAALGVKEIVLTGVNIGDFGRNDSIASLQMKNSDAIVIQETSVPAGSSRNMAISQAETPRHSERGLLQAQNGMAEEDPARTQAGAISENKETFLDLIKALDEVEGIERFRISSIEPNLLKDEIIEWVAQSKRFMPHFHIPLQSGSDTILKRMKRRYLRDLYTERVAKIKEVMPHCCIGVDVIVGFPGETDELFKETYNFLNELNVSYLHVFTYSERENTEAANMPEVVPMNVRNERNKMLRILSEKKLNAFYTEHIGETRRVLFESEMTDGTIDGYTDNYVKITMPYSPSLVRQSKHVKLQSIAGTGVAGEIQQTASELTTLPQISNLKLQTI